MKTYWKYSNFKRGPLMSFVGIGLMAASIYVYMTKPDSEMFSLTLLGLGALAIGLKDPKMPKGGAAPMMLVPLFLLTSCVTFKKCTDKFGTGETHTITVRDTVKVKVPIYLEPLTLEGQTPIQDILQGNAHTDSTDKLLIQFWYDKYSNLLSYRASLKPDTIEKEILVPVQVQGDCPDTVVLDKEKGASGIARFWERAKTFSFWLLLLLGVSVLMWHKWLKLKR